MGDHAELIERLEAWGQNSPDPDFFRGDALAAVLADCAEAADALEAAERERDEAREERDDARSTLSAWFDLSKKVEAEITPVLLGCLNGYLRTSENGGMPKEQADLVRRTLSEVIDLYAGKALVPVLRSIAEAERDALSARVAELERERDEALNQLSSVTFDRDEYRKLADARHYKLAEAREVVRGLVEYETEAAVYIGLPDCSCLTLSEARERQYEAEKCPHQRAHTWLSQHGGCDE